MSASRRRRESRARLLTVVAWATLGVAALGGATFGGVQLAKSPRFALTRVEVRGAVRSDAGDVRAAAGVAPGVDVWLIDARAVERRVERLPWIARATVVRAWPNRLALKISERRPAARLVLRGEGPARVALVDGEGRVLSVAAADPRDDALVVLSVTPTPPGADVPGTLLGDDAVRALRGARDLRRLGVVVSAVDVGPATGVAATTDAHLRVVFGTLDDLEKKVRTFAAIAARIARPGDVAYVDVRSVRAPTVMYK